MNDSTSKTDVGAVEAAIGAPLIPDCSRIAAEVTPSRGTKSQFFFSSIPGCTDSTGSVQERTGRQAHKLLASPSPAPVVGSNLAQSPALLHLYFVAPATTPSHTAITG